MQLKLCTEQPMLEFTAPNQDELLDFLENVNLLSTLKAITKNHTSWVANDAGAVTLRQVVVIGRLLQKAIVEKNLIAQCESLYREKKLDITPLKAKSFSELIFVPNDKPLDRAAHKVSRCVKKSKMGDTFYFFKFDKNASNASTEIEAFNALCYRVLLGNQASKASCVYDEYAVRKGTLSKEYPGFISLRKKQNEDKSCLVESMVKGGAGKLYMAALLEKENDLHRGNYGFVDDKLVKIDHDQATATVAWKYNPGLAIAGPYAFCLTQKDISALPFLHDAKPYNWVNRRRGKENPNSTINYEALSLNHQFQQDKYYIGLKRLLLDDAVYRAFAQATIRSEKLQKELIADKSGRTQELRAILIQLPEFIAYVKENPLAIETILTEISLFNLDFKSDKNRSLRIDKYAIHVNYDTLCDELFASEVDNWQVNSCF